VPNCIAWDPAFAGELALILEHGMRRMLEEQRDEFHYVTMGNENYAMPSLPGHVPGAGVDAAVREDLLKGMYRLHVEPAGQAGKAARASVRLLGSGAILREVLAAAKTLAAEHGVACEVYSVTSFSELAREAAALQQLDRDEPQAAPRTSHVARLLAGSAPVVAATDYVRAWPQLIAEHVPARYVTLGTDGFGRSDTRQRLREFFQVDAASIVRAALHVLR
jgi:pyruvate dehydrogenase E1 component